MDSWRRAESIQRSVRCNDGTVEPEHPGGKPRQASPEIGDWLTEAMPSVTQLFAAAHRVTGVLFLGAQATFAVGDKVAVAAGNACEWLAVHPCPDTAITGVLVSDVDDRVSTSSRYPAL